MNIIENPFYLLGASLADNRRTIMSKVQDASLLGDPDECTKAGSLLTNHKNRVKCEVFYLPDLSPMEAQTKIDQLQSDPNALIKTILSEKHYTLSDGNLIASALLSSKYKPSLNLSNDAIKALSNVLETQDSEDVFNIINEMRIKSGFSQLADISLVSDNLNDLKAFYLQAIKNLLERLSFTDITSIMSELAINETNANILCSEFISSIIDYYEVLTQPHLKDAEQDVKDLINLFNDICKHRYILSQVDFNINNFKENSRFFSTMDLSNIKTIDDAINWVSEEVSNKLSSWISTALPTIVVYKSNGVFYKDCSDIISYCLQALQTLALLYRKNLVFTCIRNIYSNIGSKFERPEYIDEQTTSKFHSYFSSLYDFLAGIDRFCLALDNVSATKRKGIFFKKVLIVKLDYFQFQSSMYSWTPILDLNLPPLLNFTYVAREISTKIDILKLVDNELLMACIKILTTNVARELAKASMLGEKFIMHLSESEQLTFYDSGLIFKGEHISWSDTKVKVYDDKVSLITDSAIYNIPQPNIITSSFLHYIIFETFKGNRGSTRIYPTLSEKLFLFSQTSRSDLYSLLINYKS